MKDVRAKACDRCAESLRTVGWLCASHAGTQYGARTAEAVEAMREARAAHVKMHVCMRDVRVAIAALDGTPVADRPADCPLCGEAQS